MIITNLKEVSKSKSEIWIDENLAFVLYKGEIRKYRLKVGEEISSEIYDEITKVVLPKRAKLRAMNLLQTKDYTEQQLRDKLLQNGYGKEIVEEAIAYVESYHYVDDYRFAKNYIEYRMEKNSKRKIESDLMRKGISKEVIQEVFSELSDKGHTIDEISMIDELLKKKGFDFDTADYKEIQRIYGFLARKGFSSDAIRKNLHSKGKELPFA